MSSFNPRIVQSVVNEDIDSTTEDTNRSASLREAPDVGSVVLSFIAIDKDGGTVTGPTGTGWSAAVVVKADVSVTIAYSIRLADGSADDLLADWTWTNAVNDQHVWIGEIVGLNGATPDVTVTANSGASAVTSQTTGTTGTTSQANAFALALFGGDTFSNIETGRSYTNGFTEIEFVGANNAGGNTVALIIATKTLTSAGTVETTFSTTDTGDQMAGIMLVFENVATADIDFYLTNSESTTAEITCRVPSGLSTTLEYSTNLDFSSSSTTGATTPVVGSDYIARFSLTSLTPNTKYYVRAIENGTADVEYATVKTLQTAGIPANFSYVFVGDTESNTESQTHLNVAALDADFFIHLGDMHYDDITTNTESLFWTAYKTVFALPNQRRMFKSKSLKYVWDDHDYSNNDSDASSPSKLAAAAAYRTFIPDPHLELPSSGGIYRAWTHGRIRFILLDTRYYRDTNTLLGSTQKTWFLAELASIAADANIKFTVVSTGVPWIATAETDTWSDATAERTEIADKIWLEGLEDKIAFIAADAHMIAYDDGTNNTFDTSTRTGWPVYQSSPLAKTGSTKGGTYSFTPVQGDLDGQYSTMSFVDITTQITVTTKGFDKDEVLIYTDALIILTPLINQVTFDLVDKYNAPIATTGFDYVIYSAWGGTFSASGTFTTDGSGVGTITALNLTVGSYYIIIRKTSDQSVISNFAINVTA